jgi:uncharacterized protein Yka (UPF0111/DUF47 family)
MSIFHKLSGFILPKEVDFFGNLNLQCSKTEQVVSVLHDIYLANTKAAATLGEAIADANTLRVQHLVELNEVLITPVDKEAISRLYLSLDWIVLSVKHLHIEISTYNISTLAEYESMLNILCRQMEEMSTCFLLLKGKKFSEVLNRTNAIIALDDALIREYSAQTASLFSGNSVIRILQHKEILTQLKEVSKRIHVCANNIEDIVFKMN